MYGVILASNREGVIGVNGKLPWDIPEDRKHFRELVSGYRVIAGYNTFQQMQWLKGIELLDLERVPTEFIWFIGGAKSLASVLKTWGPPKKVFLSLVDKSVSHVNIDIAKIDLVTLLQGQKLVRYETIVEGCVALYYEYSPVTCSYEKVLRRVLDKGIERSDRTGVGTISLPGQRIHVNVEGGLIPIFTGRKIPYRLAIQEMLWMIRGETSSNTLEALGVNIWKGNTSREFLDNVGLTHLREGEGGKIYGYQMRKYGGYYDQLMNVVNLIRNDPNSRRILIDMWNPCDLGEMALPPCHMVYQWIVYPDTRQLSCITYQRSGDMILGIPFNMIGATILSTVVGHLAGGYSLKEIVINIGDAHIYKNHINNVNVIDNMLQNTYPYPLLKFIDKGQKLPEDFNVNDFEVTGYLHGPVLKFSMAI